MKVKNVKQLKIYLKYMPYSPDKKRLYIRIHAGQDLGDDLRTRLSRDREYFKFKNLVPEVVLKEDNLDLLNACLGDTINKKIVELDEKENEKENETGEKDKLPLLALYDCDKSGELREP